MIKYVAFIVLMSIAACKPKEEKQAEVLVFAGVGMKEVVSEIIDSFQVANSDFKVLVSWGPSGVLAQQIAMGQVPDVFISANRKWVDFIDSLNLVLDHRVMNVAKNEIVLVVPKKNPINSFVFGQEADLITLLQGGFLSIGDPSYVPVGAYAKQSLDYYGLYSQVKGQVLPGKDVRSALWVVEMEEAPVGIVFRSDAMASDKVKILSEIPSESHKPIAFLAVQCQKKKGANLFYQYLDTPMARHLWVKHGFLPAED